MINRIIEYSIKNKLIIGLLTLTLIIAGIWSMSRVPIDAVPDITNNQVQVITRAPNLGTEDIEQFVTYPVEVAMANLPGVKEIRSVSRFGLSVVTIVFEDDMGTYLPRQLVQEKLGQVRAEIPEGFGETFMGPISTGLGEIYQYTLEVDSAHLGEYSSTDLRTIQDWIIRRQMAMVPGVVEVNGFGGKVKQYEVAVDPDELRSIGLTITDVFEALELNNQNTGGAYIEKDHKANFIRGEGLARSLDDIRKIAVAQEGGIPILVEDIATVGFGEAVRYGAFTKGGQGEAVGGMILMLKGANSNEVISAVKDRMASIQKSLPKGVSIEPFLDRSALIANTTNTVKTNLIEGGLIVIFILVFLLGNWRGGLIVASTIPLSLFFAFILMNVFDVWANLMSLGAIDFGIIVDGAVIIVEGTVFMLYRELQKGKKINAAKRDEIAFRASSKMMNAAFFGQLIILVVFLPILALEGVEGKMFKPMALTFIFAMMGAMLLCLTYVPAMSALFIKAGNSRRRSWGDRLVNWLQLRYQRVLDASLRRSRLVIAVALALLGLSVWTFSRMGGEFIPQLDEGDIAFHIIIKAGSSLSESIETSTKVEKIILENFPEAEKVLSRIGVAEVPTDPMPMDIADCFIILKPRDEWVSADSKDELIEKIKEKLSILPGVSYEFTQPIEMRFNELLTGVREDVAIKLFGEDLDLLASKGEEIGRLISGVEGVADMRVEATSGLPQMTVQYERGELAQYGLQIRDINNVIETAFAGGKAGVIFEGEKRFDLVVRLDSAHRTNIRNLRNLYVNTPGGVQIPLKEVAEVNYEPGPMQISRDNTNRRINVGVNVRGRDVKSVVKDIEQVLDEGLELPPGYYIRYGGAFENLERATNRLELVVPIALGLIFILIFFALGSVKQTLMIYMAIPLAAIGGVFSLWLRDMPFSISAGVGFIVLFGVAVLNGLVLISGLNELKASGGYSLRERIMQGCSRRVRPILLTALTDIFGFLPMAISTSAGAEVQRPLATVVIGGLVTSGLLTLIILPILYSWTEKNNGNKNIKMAPLSSIVLIALIAIPFGLGAQSSELPVTLDKALEKAKREHPSLQADRLRAEKQRALKPTAYDYGYTQVYGGGEEIGQGSAGVYTLIGLQQQNADVFAVGAKKEVIENNILLAEKKAGLSELELERALSAAYAALLVRKEEMTVYRELDSTFALLERIAEVRYENRDISHLDLLAAENERGRIELMYAKSRSAYRMALLEFNAWLPGDSLFTAAGMPERFDLELPVSAADSIRGHPLQAVFLQGIAAAEAGVELARSRLYPKLSASYGLQSVGGDVGYHAWQLGFTVPLLSRDDKGRIQAAKVEGEIARKEYASRMIRLEKGYRTALEQYQYARASLAYHRDEALPMALQQKEASVLAFREGAVDYTAVLQHIRTTFELRQEYLHSLAEYMQAAVDLHYYLNSN